MNAAREMRLRKEIARLINDAFEWTAPPVYADELFVWEIVKLVRNDTLRELQATVQEKKIPKE